MTPPQAKRRKAVGPISSMNVQVRASSLSELHAAPTFDQRSPSQSASYEQDLSINTLDTETTSEITSTPVRQRVASTQSNLNHGSSSMGHARRMMATPARLQPHTVREQITRPSPVDRKTLPSQVTLKPRAQKQPTSILVTPFRSTPAVPSRSVSRVSERTTYSFPAVALEFTDSDSEDSSDESFRISKPSIVSVGDRRPPLGQRAARKARIQPERKTRQDASEPPEPISLIDSDLPLNLDDEDEEDDLYVDADPAEIINRAQQLRTVDKSTGIQTPSLDVEKGKETPEDLEKELTDALDALTIREARLLARGQLPFLRRNLRKSMDALGPSKWRGHDSDAIRSIEVTHVNVIYVIAEYEYPGGSFYGRWFCPLCAINLCFNTRGALDTHLYRHHTQCAYEWSDSGDNSLLLKVTLPNVPESESGTEDSGKKEFVLIGSSSEEEDLSSDDQHVLHPQRVPPAQDKPFLRGPSVVRAQTIFSSSPSKAQPSSPILSPIRPFIVAKTTIPALPNILRPPRPIDPENPDRYPTPPPFDELEGPAAAHPYITEDTYSDRPGGPKLYDILNELNLEPFGLMTGHVIEREEDVFELGDTRDEDKVMLALWSRWIFLNRPKFIEDYEAGIQVFVDEYWRTIHRAAGFAALRTWLLVLVQNRYLTGTQFCDTLKYYKDLVGMDHWKRAWRGTPVKSASKNRK
ncbi:hypothetical protein ACEPAI_2340 [Sanghuangporus weigelae]